MSETTLHIPVEGGKIRLEGAFEEGRTGRNAVLCHPHPLYGGNMNNNVVLAARNAFAESGRGTLRYNFRGVGGSGGEPGDGDKDSEDLLAVSEYVRKNYPGQLDLAAYSYGSWVALKAVRLGLTPDLLVLISPPLEFISFAGLDLPDLPMLITIGNEDEFCSVEALRKWLANQPNAARAEVEIFPYGDHFYWGLEQKLSARIAEFLKTMKSETVNNEL